MSLNDIPSADRVHIGFFGRRNVGKSSLVNAVTGQELSVVSDVLGTTTDPVQKSMEILPLGPVVIIDTPGYDDEGYLGDKRVSKTRQILNRTDIAVLVTDGIIGECETELIKLFKAKQVPYVIAFNKSDLDNAPKRPEGSTCIEVSAATGEGIHDLKELLGHMLANGEERFLVADLIKPGDLVVLVIPIDSAAPKGRIILPQQKALREVLDAGATAIVVRETELADALESLNRKPQLVITDSQAFNFVKQIVPKDIYLTSFSILMARYKGFLDTACRGVERLENLKDGDKILISEGCSHHRQCDDIGTVKIPKWISEYTGLKLEFETTSGREFPEDLSKYRLVVHCGGCMLNEREMRYRRKQAEDQGVRFTNYGILIAYINGILSRALMML